MKELKRNSVALVTALFMSQIIQHILLKMEVLNKTEITMLFMLVFLTVKEILE